MCSYHALPRVACCSMLTGEATIIGPLKQSVHDVTKVQSYYEIFLLTWGQVCLARVYNLLTAKHHVQNMVKYLCVQTDRHGMLRRHHAGRTQLVQLVASLRLPIPLRIVTCRNSFSQPCVTSKLFTTPQHQLAACCRWHS